jgi:hypothetical protein
VASANIILIKLLKQGLGIAGKWQNIRNNSKYSLIAYYFLKIRVLSGIMN